MASCGNCGGSGLVVISEKNCSNCHGEGVYTTEDKNGNLIVVRCGRCQGTGTQNILGTCTVCKDTETV